MIYELIIIGGGPAGVTAGIYASRLGLKTLLITKSFGGQIGAKAVDIENYPGFEKISGPELVKKMEEHLKAQAVEIVIAEVVKAEKRGKNFLVRTAKGKPARPCPPGKRAAGGEFISKSLILATGADPRPLEVPGEKEFVGKGVSYCSVCDGPLFKDKTVTIIGGGNAGFETAIFLAKIVKKIYILEFGPEPKAFSVNQEIVKKSGKAEIITNAALKEIKGLPAGRQGEEFVNSIIYEDRKTGTKKELKVEGVFVEIGYQPATAYAKGLVDFNERDEISVEFETCQTKTSGVFAAGDLNVGQFKQIVTAAGEGAKAALAAYNYVQALTNKAS